MGAIFWSRSILAVLPGRSYDGTGPITGIPNPGGNKFKNPDPHSAFNAEVTDNQPVPDKELTRQAIAIGRFYG